jgi:hypothetical protein
MPIFFKQIGIFRKRVFIMKNSLTDEPELCFYAKKTTRRQNLEKVGVEFLFQKKIWKLFCFLTFNSRFHLGVLLGTFMFLGYLLALMISDQL